MAATCSLGRESSPGAPAALSCFIRRVTQKHDEPGNGVSSNTVSGLVEAEETTAPPPSTEVPSLEINRVRRRAGPVTPPGDPGSLIRSN